MNRIFTTALLLFFALSFAKAQEYIKFNKGIDYTVKKNKHTINIKCFKGEILPYTDAENKKISIKYNQDTIKGQTLNSNFSKFKAVYPEYANSKADLATIKEDGSVYFPGSLQPTDTITIISEEGSILKTLCCQQNDIINKNRLGKHFRLMISIAPSLFYDTDSLAAYKVEDKGDTTDKTQTIGGGNNTPTTKPNNPGNNYALWAIYFLIAVVIGGGGFLLWKFVFNREQPVSATFKGDSLAKFAKKHKITIDELRRLNPNAGILPGWENLDDTKKQAAKTKLTNQTLVIRETSEFSIPPQVQNDVVTDQKEVVNNLNQSKSASNSNLVSSTVSSGDPEIINRFSQQLNNVERNINQRLDTLIAANKDTSEIDRLKSDKNVLENVNSALNVELSALKADNMQVANDLNQQLSKTSALEKSLQYVSEAGYLSNYSSAVLAYLKTCAETIAEAYGYFELINRDGAQQGIVAGNLIIKFQTNTNTLPVGDWKQVLTDIKETGLCNNKRIKESFRQLGNNDERQTQFKRLLFADVLVKYSSSVLILAEEFKNLDRFHISATIAADVHNTFTKFIQELLAKSKAIELEIKYVPLFKSFEDYVAHVAAVNGEPNFALKTITGLPVGAIAEIVSYGVSTPFGDTKTEIILA